jgi:hypothetical protein
MPIEYMLPPVSGKTKYTSGRVLIFYIWCGFKKEQAFPGKITAA